MTELLLAPENQNGNPTPPGLPFWFIFQVPILRLKSQSQSRGAKDLRFKTKDPKHSDTQFPHELRHDLPIIRSFGRYRLVPLDPINDQLADLFT